MVRNFSPRELFLLACALKYARANADDLNEALADDEGSPLITFHDAGEPLVGVKVKPGEFDRLHDWAVAAYFPGPPAVVPEADDKVRFLDLVESWYGTMSHAVLCTSRHPGGACDCLRGDLAVLLTRAGRNP